jgi:hypothetical protein
MTVFASLEKVAGADMIEVVHELPAIILTQVVSTHFAIGCWV